MRPVQRALLSVSDKTGIESLGRSLNEMGVEIVSTGGTARALQELGIAVRKVSDLTGFPEILGGRVKTLHPRIHGGLLAMRDNPSQMDEVDEHGIPLIDLVVVNLYPFQETVRKPDVRLEDAIEQIDIGGVCLIRAAAKNWRDVILLTTPGDYAPVLDELRRNGGTVGDQRRLSLAARGFQHTSEYDTAIAAYLSRCA